MYKLLSGPVYLIAFFFSNSVHWKTSQPYICFKLLSHRLVYCFSGDETWKHRSTSPLPIYRSKILSRSFVFKFGSWLATDRPSPSPSFLHSVLVSVLLYSDELALSDKNAVPSYRLSPGNLFVLPWPTLGFFRMPLTLLRLPTTPLQKKPKTIF